MRRFFYRNTAVWGRAASLLFFPSFCRVCRNLLEKPEERIVCRECLAKCVPRSGPECLCCGRFFEGGEEPHDCAACLARKPAYSIHRSCGRYSGVLKDLIILYKFQKIEFLGGVLAEFAAKARSGDEDLWRDMDIVIPVPLHRRRKRERGFNQSEVMARKLARAKGIEMTAGSLVKVKDVPPQTSLEAADREQNVRGVFVVRKRELIRGRTVLLVDDVFTTGATIGESSRALREAGARDVRVLTLAQA